MVPAPSQVASPTPTGRVPTRARSRRLKTACGPIPRLSERCQHNRPVRYSARPCCQAPAWSCRQRANRLRRRRVPGVFHRAVAQDQRRRAARPPPQGRAPPCKGERREPAGERFLARPDRPSFAGSGRSRRSCSQQRLVERHVVLGPRAAGPAGLPRSAIAWSSAAWAATVSTSRPSWPCRARMETRLSAIDRNPPDTAANTSGSAAFSCRIWTVLPSASTPITGAWLVSRPISPSSVLAMTSSASPDQSSPSGWTSSTRNVTASPPLAHARRAAPSDAQLRAPARHPARLRRRRLPPSRC